ncbi:hypothetical protein BDV98DRAFT_641136, partial [Pterulicium gracile]
VSEKSIGRWVDKFEQYGDANPPIFRPGRPRIISPELLREITNRIAQYPDEYLDKMQEWLALYHNVEISKSALSESLLEMDLSWKKMRRIARNRDDQERAEWFNQFLQEFHPLHLPLEQGRCYRILLAMDINSYFSVSVKEGSFDSEDFLLFVVHKVLPRTEEWPGP